MKHRLGNAKPQFASQKSVFHQWLINFLLASHESKTHIFRMRRTKRILFISLLGILLSIFTFVVLRPSEPTYEGRELTDWLGDVSPGQDAESNEPVRQIGAKALPILLRYAADRDTRLKLFLERMADKCDWAHIDFHHAERSHGLAISGFCVLGTNALPALPKLQLLLEDEDFSVRSTACICISCIGPKAYPAVPALIKEFQRESANTNDHAYAAAHALAIIGTNASGAIPALKSALTNNSPYIRLFAQAALINMNVTAPDTFYQHLTNRPFVSAWFLADWCGSNASPAIPILLSGLRSTNLGLQLTCMSGLGSFHLQPEVCVPAIIPFLQSTNRHTRAVAIDSLKRFGKSAKQAGPALAKCLNDSDISVRDGARDALPLIDPDLAEKHGLKRMKR